MQPQQLETVADDTPCRPCGYNLRGLSPRGKCPECGGDIQDTLRQIRYEAENRRDIKQVDPKSLNEWIEGLWCLAGSFVLAAVADLDVPFYGKPNFHRKILLGLLSASWVVGCLGIWKIGRAANARTWGKGYDRPDLGLRISIVLAVVFPFAWGLASLGLKNNLQPLCVLGAFMELPCGLAIVAAGLAFHARLAWIAELTPARILKGQLYFFAMAIPAASCWIFVMTAETMSSLDRMAALPLPAFISPIWVAVISDFHNVDPISLAIAAALAWEPAILLLLLIRLHRARSRMRNAAATGESKNVA